MSVLLPHWALWPVAIGICLSLPALLWLRRRRRQVPVVLDEDPHRLCYCEGCGCRHRRSNMDWTPGGVFRCQVCCLDYDTAVRQAKAVSEEKALREEMFEEAEVSEGRGDPAVLDQHVRLRPSDVFLKRDPSDRFYSPWDDENFEKQLDEWLDTSGVDLDDEEACLSAIEEFEEQWRKDFEEQWRRQAVAEAAGTDVVEVYESLKAAGLDSAYLKSPVFGGDVGGFLLACPSGFRNVRDDEAFELSRARRASLHTAKLYAKSAAGELDDAESDALDETEASGALLLLLRPTRIEMVDEDDFDYGKDDPQFVQYRMSLRSGDIIELQGRFTRSQVATLRGSCWVVVEANGYIDGEEVSFWADFVLAVPDTRPLRVSDIHPSLSKALCFDTVCRYLLSRLDLSEESLPDPSAARDFITQIHSDGLPPDRIGPVSQAGRRVPFRERLLAAMGPISGQESSSPAPNNNLEEPAAESGSTEETTAQDVVLNRGEEGVREGVQGVPAIDSGAADAGAEHDGDDAVGVLAVEAASERGVGDFTVTTWNTQWATPSSDRGARISATLAASHSDVIVVTEGVHGLLPEHGYMVDAGADWGYAPKPNRRKVIVWSRYPLTLDFIGDEGANLGRMVVATAALPGGPVRIVGVCIPWRDAHVNTGRGDAQPWSEHLDYLDRLARILSTLDPAIPTVIAGDFNQRIPRARQPLRVADRLGVVLADWTIHTAGSFPNGPHIDHIATNGQLVAYEVRDWPAADHLGRLSDHAGVACRLAVAEGTVGRATSAEAATGARLAEQKADSAVVEASPRSFDAAAAGPVLTTELLAEIKGILRRTPDGFEHGVAFRLREQGRSDAEIINKSGGIGTSRRWLNSLDRLLSGARPTSKSAALDTSYGYRELFNHPRSDDLDRYARARLHELKELNPEVRFDPLHTRTRKHRAPERKSSPERPIQNP